MINPHPVGVSHFTDGAVPSQTSSTSTTSDEKLYLQPAVEVQKVPEGAKVKEQRQKSLCDRIAEQQPIGGIGEWLGRNKTTIGWIAGGYITLRILTKRK